MPRERESETGTPKHDIVVVTEGNVPEKDPDPELTKLNTIPVFYPIMRGSLNIPTSSRDLDLLDKMNHEQLLYLCVRYQEHLKQLAESVTFDQNALCVRIKEVNIYPVRNQVLDHKNLNSFKEIINNMKRWDMNLVVHLIKFSEVWRFDHLIATHFHIPVNFLTFIDW